MTLNSVLKYWVKNLRLKHEYLYIKTQKEDFEPS